MQVDKGAIKHVLNGADIMAPGLTNPGGEMVEAEEGEIVSIFGHGKVHAIAIGKMLMSTEEILEKKKGMAIEMLHYLGDALFHYNLSK